MLGFSNVVCIIVWVKRVASVFMGLVLLFGIVVLVCFGIGGSLVICITEASEGVGAGRSDLSDFVRPFENHSLTLEVWRVVFFGLEVQSAGG